MPSTITQTTIANRALQLLGYKSISSINDNDRGAAAVRRAYNTCLLAELRDNYWSFAIQRVQLAASATPPTFGKSYSYPLPGDFIKLAPPDPDFNFNYIDWQIEGQAILTDDEAPLNVRYISSNVTESMFDPSFAEALAARIAGGTCEELTNSNTKLTSIAAVYKAAIDAAAKNNAFESRPVRPPLDKWITKRF